MPVDTFNIFLSHIHEEQELAHALKNAIESAFLDAVRVFVSSHEQDVRVGDEWFKEIEASLRESEAVILLLSPQSVKRPWVNFEAGAAWFLDRRVIPICSRGLSINDLPPPFSKRQAISIASEEDRDTLIEDIASVAGLRVPDYSFDEIIEKNSPIENQNQQGTGEEEQQEEGEDDEEEILPSYSSSELFEWRLSDAFPGLRDVKIIKDAELAVDRLEIVLRDPLFRRNPGTDEGRYFPFWWFRGGNYPIDKFRRLGRDRCLVGMKELRIARIAAVRSFSSGERDFLYLESTGQEPIGCYEYGEGEIQRRLEKTREGEIESDYCVREEYGLWQGHPITREEYDDGAAMINGEPTRTEGAELRARYLTPHNMLICSKISVVNNHKIDRKLRRVMNKILRNESDVSDLIAFVDGLPRNPHADSEGLV